MKLIDLLYYSFRNVYIEKKQLSSNSNSIYSIVFSNLLKLNWLDLLQSQNRRVIICILCYVLCLDFQDIFCFCEILFFQVYKDFWILMFVCYA